jgi:hypothetical protein
VLWSEGLGQRYHHFDAISRESRYCSENSTIASSGKDHVTWSEMLVLQEDEFSERYRPLPGGDCIEMRIMLPKSVGDSSQIGASCRRRVRVA